MSDGSSRGETEFERYAQWRLPERRSTFIGRFWRSLQLRNWPIGIVFFVCIGVFIAQVTVPLPIERWGLSAASLQQGHFETLFSHLVMHGNVMHLVANMAAYVAVAPLVCARFGTSLAGIVSFHVFFLLCGLIGSLIFLALHTHDRIPIVGASGAIYGLFGAAFRLDSKSDRLRAHSSRPVLSGWKWMVISNLTIVLMVGGPTLLSQILEGDFSSPTILVAWEAHVGGFIAGLLLVSLMANKGWPDDWRGGFFDPDEAVEDLKRAR